MSTDAIFWDNDGVLVDTERLYLQATRRVLASVDVPLTDEQYRELFLVQGIGAWHLVEAKGFSLTDVDRLRETRNSLYAQSLARAPVVIEGVRDVLEALHGRCHMGVVTSSRKDHFDLIHEKTGLLKYFDFVLTSEDFARMKPDPEPYLRALERSGFAAERCLAIEDSERGLAAAKAAGIRCIVVPTALTRKSTFEGAHLVLGSVSEILRVV